MTTTLDSPETSQPEPAQSADDRRDALAERLFLAMVGGIELLSVDLGRRLGLYQALHRAGSVNSTGLAKEAGIAERYAREWLEQQAAAGFLDVVETSDDPQQRRFTLPAGHVPVLLEPENPAYVLGAAPLLVGCALTLPAVTEAYRTGGGVSFEDFGDEIRHGLSMFNRPAFANDLASWFEAMPDVVQRLRAGGTVLDAGCGTGFSTLAIARAFPHAEVYGVDLDAPSIREARAHAADAGLAERVSYTIGDAARSDELPSPETRRYDLVCVFEALHDMGDPIGALRSFRDLLNPGGVLLVADERVADTFAPPTEEVERMQYAFSVTHCLPATMHESTETASGTALRAPTVREWASRAGYGQITELPVENLFWRFYRFDQ